MITGSNKRRDRKGRHRGGGPARNTTKKPPLRDMPTCSICEKPIKEILSALANKVDGSAVHFNCALKKTEEILKPQSGEKIVYCGNHIFAIINAQAYQNNQLIILRKTNWENPDNTVEWQKDLQIHVH